MYQVDIIFHGKTDHNSSYVSNIITTPHADEALRKADEYIDVEPEKFDNPEDAYTFSHIDAPMRLVTQKELKLSLPGKKTITIKTI